MANFDDFKQKAWETMESIADKSVELYKMAEEKTKIFARITKLTTEIALEKSTVRKHYKEIGKKYYELHNAAPEEAFSQACAEVTVSLDCISAKQKEIDELKKSYDFGDKSDNEDSGKDIDVAIIFEDFDETTAAAKDADSTDVTE